MGLKQVEVDSTLLRRGLRLVHCLQKERGASCAYVASQNVKKNISDLDPARRDSDQALSLLLSGHNLYNGISSSSSSVLLKSLNKVRKMTIGGASQNHRILLCFNTIISAVSHDFIFKQTAFQKSLQSKSSSLSSSQVGNIAIPRVRSFESMDPGMLAPLGHRRNNSDSGGSAVVGLPPSSSSANANNHFPCHPRGQSDTELLYVKTAFDVSQQHTLPRIPSESSDLNANASQGDSKVEDVVPRVSFWLPAENEPDNAKIVQFLDILDVFVALKESTGRERAILSSISVAGDPTAAQYMMNDLVLEVENQKRRLEQLGTFKKSSLFKLVQELVALSPFLVSLQTRILAGPNPEVWETTGYSTEELWDLLTNYMDKLHSLELLIVEELECAVFANRQQNSGSTSQNATITSDALKRVFGEFDSHDDLCKRIENMPPENTKALLLALLNQQPGACESASSYKDTSNMDNYQETAGKSTNELPNRLDALLKELSSEPQNKEWEIDLYNVKFLKRIGQGSAGTTYLGEWEGSRIAVKVAAINEMGLAGWRTEAKALQKLHHPNIIRLLGAVYHPDPVTFCLVLEYCNGGDLSNAMRRPTPKSFFFQTARGIAKGLAYLHSRGIIHRDVKPSNILIDGDISSGKYEVKLTDFGVSTESSRSKDRTAETGTYRWMAPEVIRHEQYGQPADVYSFAVVMWQLITREIPFEDKSTFDAAATVAMEHGRPPFPANTPLPIRTLIESCWVDNAEERPSFNEIVGALDKLSKELTDEERLWLEASLGHKVYEIPVTVQKPIKKVQLQIPVQPGAVEPKEAKNKRHWKGLFSRKSSYF